MSNLLLGWPNRLDSSTLSGGSWSTSLPLSNLQSRSLAVVARSADDANALTKFIIDQGAALATRAVAIANHNLSAASRIKISIGSSSGGAQVYAGSWLDCYAITFGTGADEWQDYNWWEPMATDDYVGSPFMVSVVLPQNYTGRYVLVELDDTSNVSGWVQIGRVFVGSGFQPNFNAVYGGTDGWESRSEAVEMESGAQIVWPRRTKRVVRFDVPVISHSTEFGIVHEMQRRAATHGDVLYIPNPADRVATQRTGFLGTMKTLNPIAYPSYRTRSATFDLVESL